MDSAIEFLLFKTALPGTIGKVLHSYNSVTVERTSDFDDDAANASRELCRIQKCRDVLPSDIGFRERAWAPGMEIQDDVVICGSIRHNTAHCRERFAEPGTVGMSGNDMNLPAFVLVFRSCVAPAVCLKGSEFLQVANAVIPPHNGLQHRVLHYHISGGEPTGKQTDERLRTFDQLANALVPIIRVWVSSEMSELFFDFVVHLFSSLIEERLIEEPVAHLASQVADRGKVPIAFGNQPVEQRTEGIFGRTSKQLDRRQASLQHGKHYRNLRLNPLMRLIDPEHALLQFRRRIECMDAIVRQGTAQCLYE